HVSSAHRSSLARYPRTSYFFFFNATAPTEIYTLSLHDALPISVRKPSAAVRTRKGADDSPEGSQYRRPPARHQSNASRRSSERRSEEHTSELQSLTNLVCRLLLEKKKKKTQIPT